MFGLTTIGVDPLLLERLEALAPGVVELARLADLEGPGAEDEDLVGTAERQARLLADELGEPVEDEPGLLRAGVALGVALEREDPAPRVAEPLEGPVVRVRRPGREAGLRERGRVDGVAVVLADDEGPALREADRLVLAAVAELELVRRRPAGEGEELVAEADPEGRAGRRFDGRPSSSIVVASWAGSPGPLPTRSPRTFRPSHFVGTSWSYGSRRTDEVRGRGARGRCSP